MTPLTPIEPVRALEPTPLPLPPPPLEPVTMLNAVVPIEHDETTEPREMPAEVSRRPSPTFGSRGRRARPTRDARADADRAAAARVPSVAVLGHGARAAGGPEAVRAVVDRVGVFVVALIAAMPR